MSDKLISIIVPIYNGENCIGKCIDSIVNQTYKNMEILLIDDGSKDNTFCICSEYAKRDVRVNVIHTENKGVSAARNLGLDKCNGEYIVFIDCDDYVELEMIEVLFNTIKETDYDLLMFGAFYENYILNKTVIDNVKDIRYMTSMDVMKELPILIENESINCVWNKMYRRSVIEENLIRFDEGISIGEDALFNYRIFSCISSMKVHNENFYHYCIYNDESLSKKFNSRKYEMLMYVNSMTREVFDECKYKSSIIMSLQNIKVKNIYSCLFDLYKKTCPYSYKEKLEYIQHIRGSQGEKCLWNSKKYYILNKVLNVRSNFFIYFLGYIIYRINLRRR